MWAWFKWWLLWARKSYISYLMPMSRNYPRAARMSFGGLDFRTLDWLIGWTLQQCFQAKCLHIWSNLTIVSASLDQSIDWLSDLLDESIFFQLLGNSPISLNLMRCCSSVGRASFKGPLSGATLLAWVRIMIETAHLSLSEHTAS